MSALELYMMPNYSENQLAPIFFTVTIIFLTSFIQQQFNKQCMSKYVEALQTRAENAEQRVTAVEAAFKGFQMYLLDLDDQIENLQILIDKNVESHLAALDETTKELAAEVNAHKGLLSLLDEDYSITADSECAEFKVSPAVRKCAWTAGAIDAAFKGDETIDELIKKYLRASPKKTVHEITDELFKGKGLQGVYLISTRKAVNRRLYSLLSKGELKKDESAPPFWSLTL